MTARQHDGKRLRVALFSATLGGGGAERVMATLANGLTRIGHDVDIVLVKKSGTYVDELDPSVRVIDLRVHRTLLAFSPLTRYLRERRPAALLATQTHLNVIAVLARWISRTPTRVLVRESSTFSLNTGNMGALPDNVARPIVRWCYSAADRVIAPSVGVADDLVATVGICRTRISVVPNPIDFSMIRARAGSPTPSPSGHPLVVAAGRLAPEKDYPVLIEALKLVRQVHDAHLLILGEGPERDHLERLVAEMNLGSRVSMPGFVKNPFTFMKQASVFVLSSRFEGMPNSLLQALALEIPVVSTACPNGPSEILEDGRWGRLVPVGDVRSLGAAIIDALAGRVARAPLDLLEERYGLQPVAQRYATLLAKPPTARESRQ